MNILDRLQKIFRDVFDDETLILTRETATDDIEEWDSLAQVSIIVACEAEFRIKFDLNDVRELKDAGSIADVIERKLKL